MCIVFEFPKNCEVYVVCRQVCLFLERAASDCKVQLVCGGRTDPEVGYFVEPSVFLVPEPTHELLCDELRGPVLAVCGFPDDDPEALVWAMARTPYAVTGSIFARVSPERS